MTAATALIVALVPLLVALLSTLRWPTLRRRIGDHAALVKELPPELAAPLHELIEKELAALVFYDRGMLDRPLRNLRYAARAARTLCWS